jgi:photosystem II stability/assembly factor-like uncharacterized protein
MDERRSRHLEKEHIVASRRSASRIACLVVLLCVFVGLFSASASAAPPLATPNGLWTWVRPLPFGFPANAIASPAPGTLFVASTESDLLVTHDGGTSWGWSHAGAPRGFSGLSSLAFASPLDGWLGTEGALLHTGDGGLSWQTQLTSPHFSFSLVRFSDASSGWAVAESGDYVELYSTRDGGKTWAQVQIPQGNYTFNTLSTTGPGQALLVQQAWQSGVGNGDDLGSRLWGTSDYGAHWSAPAALRQSSIRSVTFTSAQRALALDSMGPVWVTDDGGSTWHKSSAFAAHSGVQAITSFGTDVWATGSTGTRHSADGGMHWRKLSAASGYQISFANSLEGWLVDGAAYLHTTDGGTSWQRLTDAPKAGPGQMVATPGGAVWGTAGYVLKSLDGGLHWQRVTQRSSLSAVAAIDANQAWAVGSKGLIIHTADGGRHWGVQRSGTARNLSNVVFVDARHGWASGQKVILRTLDGGRHWIRHFTTVGFTIGLSFADAQHGIAVPLNRSVIFITSDGGRTWSTSRFSPLGYYATAVVMKDATHALLLSNLQHSWITSDGGRSWQQSADLPPTLIYSSLTRSGPLLCAVGWNGAVATSADDGASWTFDDNLQGLVSCSAFVGDHTLLVAGGPGVLMRDLSRAPLR